MHKCVILTILLNLSNISSCQTFHSNIIIIFMALNYFYNVFCILFGIIFCFCYNKSKIVC